MSSYGWFPLNRKQIREWLDRHPGALPQSLDEIARFPVAFRRVMINAVSAEVRVQLWQEHLETFLRPGSSLDEAQRRLVAISISRLPELLAAPGPSPVLIEWERQIAKAFSRPEAARVFGLIGPPEPPEGLPLPPDALPAPAV